MSTSMGGAEAEGEADSSLSRELDVGLDPRTPGSWPELKADAHANEPPRCPSLLFFLKACLGPPDELIQHLQAGVQVCSKASVGDSNVAWAENF